MKTERKQYRSESVNEEIFLPRNAQWITHSFVREEMLEFEKKFECGKVKRARLFICGLGFFEAYLNGRRIGEEYFKPVVTDYEKRDLRKNRMLVIGTKQIVCGHLYDVTERIQEGINTLSALVGNGYYSNEEKTEEPSSFYAHKKLIFELCIEDERGETRIVSDGDTGVRYVPMRSLLFSGDQVDFSAEAVSFSGATLAPAPSGEWRVLTDEDDRLCDCLAEEILPVSTQRFGKSVRYDFGKNHSGSVAFTVQGERGREIKLRFAEVLYEDGTLNMETGRWDCYNAQGERIRCIDQECRYTLSGGKDEIEPLFSWRCYRYMEIENADGLTIENMRSMFIHTKIEETGSFSCGEPIFNRLQQATRLSVLNNMHAGLLTDCPHREKRPYTGDGQVVSEMMLYDLNAEHFFDKWLWDIIYAQGKNGMIPHTAPHHNGGGGYAWGYAIAELPDTLYRFTGNVEYVERSYDALVKWLKYCKKHSIKHIVSSYEDSWYLGDWLAPEITEFNIPFMSTLCYYRGVCVAERFARVLKNGEAENFAQLKDEIRNAINDKFFNREKISYCNGIQGENVLPLAFGIVPKEYVAALKEKVRYTYETENNGHLDTGIVATPILIEYLTLNGMKDIAYKIMTQTDYPSYAYMLEGETTLSEHWSKRWPDYHIDTTDAVVKGGGHLSHCHHMFGSVVAWLYKRVAGIDCSEAYSGKLRFAPCFTEYLPHANAEVKTRFGKAAIAWKSEESFEAELLVPEGAIGEFVYETKNALRLEGEQESRTLLSENGVVKIELSTGKWRVSELSQN